MLAIQAPFNHPTQRNKHITLSEKLLAKKVTLSKRYQLTR